MENNRVVVAFNGRKSKNQPRLPDIMQMFILLQKLKLGYAILNMSGYEDVPLFSVGQDDYDLIHENISETFEFPLQGVKLHSRWFYPGCMVCDVDHSNPLPQAHLLWSKEKQSPSNIYLLADAVLRFQNNVYLGWEKIYTQPTFDEMLDRGDVPWVSPGYEHRNRDIVKEAWDNVNLYWTNQKTSPPCVDEEELWNPLDANEDVNMVEMELLHHFSLLSGSGFLDTKIDENEKKQPSAIVRPVKGVIVKTPTHKDPPNETEIGKKQLGDAKKDENPNESGDDEKKQPSVSIAIDDENFWGSIALNAMRLIGDMDMESLSSQCSLISLDNKTDENEKKQPSAIERPIEGVIVVKTPTHKDPPNETEIGKKDPPNETEIGEKQLGDAKDENPPNESGDDERKQPAVSITRNNKNGNKELPPFIQSPDLDLVKPVGYLQPRTKAFGELEEGTMHLGVKSRSASDCSEPGSLNDQQIGMTERIVQELKTDTMIKGKGIQGAGGKHSVKNALPDALEEDNNSTCNEKKRKVLGSADISRVNDETNKTFQARVLSALALYKEEKTLEEILLIVLEKPYDVYEECIYAMIKGHSPV